MPGENRKPRNLKLDLVLLYSKAYDRCLGVRRLNSTLLFDAGGLGDLQVLLEDTERALCRGRRVDLGGGPASVLIVFPAVEHPPSAVLDRFAHEYGLRDELDNAWAARPLELAREGGHTFLLLDDPGGEPLELLIDGPMETGRFLRLAIGIAAALGKVHQRNLVHKDLKPANIIVNCADGRARLIGFGAASRLLRERHPPAPAEIFAGTLAYMAPEQTGRMNRSVDSRSDLYALGVTFYRMLTGRLPFSADDPLEWIHCHIARKPCRAVGGNSGTSLQYRDEAPLKTGRGALPDCRRPRA